DQFKKMTHVSISFLRAANSEGDIKMTNGWENIDEVIAAAHSNNVKVLISFGGGEFKVTSELMGVKENRQNLIRNIIDFMIKHNLDGFDCDWEPSWINNKAEMEAINNAITNYYIVFIKEFREALDIEFGKGNKLFTAAILNANNIWYSDEKQIAHFPQNGWWNYLDWVSLMNYDNDVGEKHATFESVFGVDGSVAYWTTFGIPHKKIVTGIPFYARAGWGSEWLFYKQVIEMNPAISDTLNFIIHNKNDSGDKVYGFNGTKVAVQKVAEGKNLNLAGIMFWQLAGDVPSFHKKSLLKAMHEEFIK
ncbi:MAG: glycoside hydrolase family 18 protein, partial [Candidatus Marinimicrobia bacterium]|nr:glycoside hydrolase family 18 protein [Candidatus Neomarinimicrobiota bacterium]